MTRLKLAVVGAGHLGRIHAKLLSEMADVELVGIVDLLPAARDSVAAACRTTAFEDHRQLIGRVDGAVIATPTRFHCGVALDFLQAGTPLLIEKPLAVDLAEADEIVRVAQTHDTMVQVGHIERYNPAFEAARRHVAQPRYIDAVRASGFTGRSTDIGVVHDLMIHDIDLVLSMVDAPLVRVSAMGMAILGRHEDAAQARLEFENGTVANLCASRVSYDAAPKRKMQLWCADGFAAIDFGNRTVQIVRPSAAVIAGTFDFNELPAEAKASFKDHVFRDILPLESLEVEARNALADEHHDFVGAIRTSRAPRVDARAGRDAVAVAEAVLESIRTHRWQATGAAAGSRVDTAAPSILRPPHWQPLSPAPQPIRREAG